MKDYTQFMSWAVVYFIDRSTQDDRKSKLEVEALFSNPVQAKDNYIIRNEETKRYIVHVWDLEKLEKYYNFLQDLKEKYGPEGMFHKGEKYFDTIDRQRFDNILNTNAWQSLDEIP